MLNSSQFLKFFYYFIIKFILHYSYEEVCFDIKKNTNMQINYFVKSKNILD